MRAPRRPHRLFAATTVLVLATLASAGADLGRPAPAAALAGDDTVLAFGAAGFHGSTSGSTLRQPLVGMANTPDGEGYWLVARDGGVFTFGSARFYGSTGALALRQPIVGMTATPDGKGYWLVARDGGVFTFGSARFYGSAATLPLVAPIIAIVPAPDGGGYWLLASDGGVFSFGSADFHGSTGGLRLDAPIVGMAATPGGDGYWLVGSDGGVFAFGAARFHGSMGGTRLVQPVVGMDTTGSGGGYWLAARDGGVFAFGDAGWAGSAAGRMPGGRWIAQIDGLAAGTGYRMLALPIPYDEVLLARGAHGESVRALQVRLVGLGYWLGLPDGVYGLLTEQAVTAFQKTLGLPRTGKVDRLTQIFLDAARRPRPRSASGYVVEVDKARQIVILARDGRTDWVLNTSTGTERPYVWEGNEYLADTPVGHFTVSREIDGIREGALGRLYRPKYFHPDGIAVHGSSNVPSYPASHGCVRVTNAAIDWVWEAGIIPIGTAVWVY